MFLNFCPRTFGLKLKITPEAPKELTLGFFEDPAKIQLLYAESLCSR